MLELVLVLGLDNIWNLFLVVHDTTAYNSSLPLRTIYCSSRGISTALLKYTYLKRPLYNKKFYLFLFVEFLKSLEYCTLCRTMVQLCAISGQFVC